MSRGILIGVTLLVISPKASAQNDRLYGTWRLVNAVTTVIATGEKYEPYGKAPRGFITYGPEGRMQVIIVFDQRPKPTHEFINDMTDKEGKELLRTMTAYVGTYTFDGKAVTHHVDVSWDEVSTGTDRVRDVQFDAGKVTLTTRPAPDRRDGRMSTVTLVWEKVR